MNYIIKAIQMQISTAINMARERGYELDENEVFTKIGSGPRKPEPGDTNHFTLSLTKHGKSVREALQIQVFNTDKESRPFELNSYIW